MAGVTTFSPGTWANQASGFWEWNGPPRLPPPEGARTTMGIAAPQRYRHLAAKFTIWSKAQVMKSANCISATGRRPMMEAPMAAPTMADSARGVSMTRRSPKRSSMPAVTLNAPP